MLGKLARSLWAPCALLLLSLPASAQERQWSDGELRSLSQGLAGYLEARRTTVGLGEARTVLVKALAELGDDLAGDPLRQSADLARAVWLARGYDDRKLRPGVVTEATFAGGSFPADGLAYAFRLPKDYAPEEAAFPIVLALPDADERPVDHLRTNWTHRELLDGAILVSPAMPADGEEWARLMVDGRPGGLVHLLTALRVVTERFAVDPDRVYLAGRGKSVPAAVAAGNYAPQLFAGVLGLAGDKGELGCDNFGNLPTLFAGGGAHATAFHEATEEAGFDNCTLHPGASEEDVWNWMQAHPRNAHPTAVTVVPGDPFPTRAYWLRIAPNAPSPRVTGTIDRDANKVTLEGADVSQATLYLNDALVDLDRPVTVVCNGVESTPDVSRDLASTLDMLYDDTSDAGCVYVVEVVCDMSGQAPVAAVAGAPADDDEYTGRLAIAAGDAGLLWELYEWCLSSQREARGPAVLAKLLRLEPDHAAARAALGHERSGSHWFTSRQARERYERSQDPAVAEARGLVKYKSTWVHPDERALAAKGQVKDPQTGLWITSADQKLLAKGWLHQDLELIAPDEAWRVDDGLWHVDGEWIDLERANRRRSKVDRMWRIPSAEVLLFSTADREVSLRALAHMQRALDDLRRVFGAEPALPLAVALLRDEEQYDRFAFGDPSGRRLATHAGRLHVIHSAFLAESWFPLVDGRREFRGMGACYWDALSPHGDAYGVHSARLAVGLSYVDALDPSPKAVQKALKEGPGPDFYEAYLAEKKLPAWLRYGGAVYAERFFRDDTVAEDGDPWWARAWSISNLVSAGGPRPLDEILAFELDPSDREDGRARLIEAGLLVAFLVDGDCAPVAEAHAELQRALVSRRLHANDIEALTTALVEHEAELRAFAGL